MLHTHDAAKMPMSQPFTLAALMAQAPEGSIPLDAIQTPRALTHWRP